MPSRLFADWPLKLLALAIAFGLWVSITGEDRAVRDLDVALDVRLRPEHTLATSPPTKVAVRVEGPRTVIRQLDPLDLVVRFDLQDTALGPRDVQLVVSHLEGLPRRVGVVFFEPDRVSLIIERRLRRELPIVADLVGAPPPGHMLYGTRLRPPRLMVDGPESVVAHLNELRTGPLPLEQRTGPFSENLELAPAGPAVRLVDPRPVEVRVFIDTPPVERTFDAVPVAPAGGAGSPKPAAARIVLSGPATVLARLGTEQIRAVADAGALDGSGERSVQLTVSVVDLPEDQLACITVKRIEPRSVAVRLVARSGGR
jgi:hypothetical protein